MSMGILISFLLKYLTVVGILGSVTGPNRIGNMPIVNKQNKFLKLKM